MTEKQWEILLRVVNGETLDKDPTGFIIDSPWLPGWFGISTIDYYVSENMWFDANLSAVNAFPNTIFLPGFWSEFGMCTEPSAFGSKQTWSLNNLPYSGKIITDAQDVVNIEKPNVRTDGLLPFMIMRLVHNEERIKKSGHLIKFAVSRGPLNIASFLMGTTELMMGVKTIPEKIHSFLTVITDFIVDWITLQAETFKSIEGILVLDDIVGFLGEGDFKEFALPYLKDIYQQTNMKVNFFHNDAKGLITAKYLTEIGVNLFNFSYEHSIREIQDLTKGEVALLGNIPPRDVLAAGSPHDVIESVKILLNSDMDRKGVILSCGGGMPPDVPTENIQAFIDTVEEFA